MLYSFPTTFYDRVMEVLMSSIDEFDKSDDPETVLTSTLELLAHFLQLHKGRILLWDNTTSCLAVKYSYGLSQAEIKRAKYQVCEGVTGNILSTGLPALITNVSQEPKFVGKITHVAKASPISYIAVPICYKNIILGVLAVECKHQQQGDMESHTVILKCVAELFAKIIHSYSLCDFAPSESTYT